MYGKSGGISGFGQVFCGVASLNAWGFPPLSDTWPYGKLPLRQSGTGAYV